MNYKKIRNYQIFSIFFTFLLGTILHFTFEWSRNNQVISIFSSINESVWEHLKLLFFPMLLTTIIGLLYFRINIPNYICSKSIGIFVAMAFTVIFFYTYTGILGINIALIDISSFFIATILGEITSYILIINKYTCSNFLAIVFLFLMCICFIVFTFNPPKIGLFKDLSILK